MTLVHAGKQIDRSTISYEAPGDMITRIMGVFLALGSIAFAFGDTILPEIQVCSCPGECVCRCAVLHGTPCTVVAKVVPKLFLLLLPRAAVCMHFHLAMLQTTAAQIHGCLTVSPLSVGAALCGDTVCEY